ncbi:MAG TPA: DUF58 domain-containing protein [Fimbriimonadaceae bacterium]|nr:DUF58 domain-containing protein [Fimbriimonadaceae bacterium]
MNRYASFALSIASLFFMVMAILVNSPPLFYMVTAVLATLGASTLQAWLSVRSLRFERFAPPAVQVGEPVTVEITVWSERRIMRPLITVFDRLPKNLVAKGVRPSLPIAPSYDQPIQTRYTFRPMRRGRYKWSGLRVRGTDALGLVNREKTYKSDPVELTVYPAPIPVSLEISPVAGWGVSDMESGRAKGAGLEPRTIREYSPGDPLRYVHWKSSARTGKLMVKEFETGSGVAMSFFIQRKVGTEVGNELASTLEAMCGHALYLSEQYLQSGAFIGFPVQEDSNMATSHPEARIRDVREILTDLHADSEKQISEDIDDSKRQLTTGMTVIAMIAVQDARLPEVIMSFPDVHFVCLVYDCNDYDERASKSGVANAADPTFLARLEAAGAEVHMMPRVETLG